MLWKYLTRGIMSKENRKGSRTDPWGTLWIYSWFKVPDLCSHKKNKTNTKHDLKRLPNTKDLKSSLNLKSEDLNAIQDIWPLSVAKRRSLQTLRSAVAARSAMTHSKKTITFLHCLFVCSLNLEPNKWNDANSNCAGKKQSPINIVTRKTLKDERLTPFKFDNYQEIFRGTIKNNGHSGEQASNQTSSSHH